MTLVIDSRQRYKHAAASEERGKRKSVQISDGKQLDEEGEEAQPTTSREKRRLSRGSCANSDLDETQTTNGRGKRRRVSRRSYADYDYDDYVLHACDECDKSYPTYHGLLIHQGRNHKQIKKFACEVCCKRFTERHVCEKHIEAVHLGLIHKCEICEKSFSTRRNVLNHIAAIHNGKLLSTSFIYYQESGVAIIVVIRTHRRGIFPGTLRIFTRIELGKDLNMILF
ncbi:hypothetical protein ACTXT7_009517 [Hymenolepis weldensis]